ncbi:MAG: hypothetical protein ACKO8I_15120 [Cyanobacteriota bacterium]
MTSTPLDDTSPELVLIPHGAIRVDPSLPAAASDRELAVAALRQGLADRSLDLPLGPELDPADPARLLAVNHLAVQLVCAPLLADQVAIPLSFWRTAATAPQLLLLAAVEDENGWVHFVGTLTAQEFVALAPEGIPSEDGLLLPVARFPGGLSRFLSLVRLMQPEALPRLAYPLQSTAAATTSTMAESAVAVWDWLNGRLADSLRSLGGTLLLPAAVPVRHAPAELPPCSPAGVAHDIALRQGQLVWGEEDPAALENFRLLIAPAGPQPERDGLIVSLRCLESGVPLPDGLRLRVRQGESEQILLSKDSLTLELSLPGGPDEIAIALHFQESEPLALPPLTLLPPNER